MTRFHGRNGQVYLAVASGGTAAPLPFQATWTINMSVDKQDVTAFGDANKSYVAGLPDSSGDFGGFLDDSTSQTYIAATDGLPRNFYLYPSTLTTTEYFFGTILPDFSVAGGVGAVVSIKSTWNAASTVQRMRAGVIG